MAHALKALALLAIGCGSADASSSCEYVFSPVPGLATDVEAAASRWSIATSCNVHTGNQGVVVRTAPRLTDAATGDSLLGGTHWSPIEVVIDADIGGETRQRTLLHEMGHALAGKPGHSVDGVMMQSAPADSKITESTLQLVCAQLECPALVPDP